MLENKPKNLDNFDNLHEYYQYLMERDSVESFGYNPLLKHTNKINQNARVKYKNYKNKLQIAVYKRLLKETQNKNKINLLIKKEYFLDNDPVTYTLKKEPQSIFKLIHNAKQYFKKVNSLAKNKFDLQEDKCFLCKGKNRIFIKHEYNDTESLLLCPHLYNEVVDIANISKRFEKKGFHNFKVDETNKAAFNSLKKYKNNFDVVLNNGKSLLIIGDVGTGKTHLAIATLLNLLYKPVFYKYKLLQKKYISLPIFLNNLKATGDDNYLKIFSEAEFLIIDDLGIENLDEWSTEKVFTLVNKRYQDQLPTIFVSDLSPKNLVDKLDKRIISRLYEMSRGIVMSGEDKRISLNTK